MRWFLLLAALLSLSLSAVSAAAQSAAPRINPLTGKPYSAAGQAEYERKQREAEEQSRMAEEAAAQDNKAFEELRARNAEQIRQFDEAIETWKDTTPPPPGTVETFVSTSYDNETALGERAEITFYNKYDVPTHKVQFGPDGKPTGPVTLTQQGKVWETIGPRIPPGGGVETSYGEDFEGNRIITRARIFTAGGKSIGDYKFNFDGVPWWGETRDPETGLINGGFMDERLKPPEATLGGPLPFPSQIRLITGVCEPCRALMEKHNSLALDINEIIIEMKSLSQEHQRAWPPAQRPIHARHAVLSARLAELMPQMEALQAEVIECDKRCRPAAQEPPPTVVALPGQPLLRPPAGIGARPTAPEKTYRPGLDAFPADDADLRAVAEAAQRYLAAAELCETMLCPVCDCEEAKASAQALADMEAYLEAMLPYLRAANDAHMERFTTTARNNITNGEQLERTIWAVGVHTYLQNFGSSLLDVASIAGWLRDIVTAERGLDELSPVEMLDQLNSAYEALKDLESLTATIAEAQTGQPQDTPVADLVELAAGADKAFINDATSYITDLKDIVTNAVEHGRDWRAALKAGAGPALGQIVGRILKTYSAAVLEERKGVLDDLLNNAAVGDLQQAREFLELQRVQNRRWAAEDALAAVRAARRRYMACVHEACGSFSLTRANIPTFRADVPGGKPKLSWGSALPWFNRAIDETLPLMKPVVFRSECPEETAEPPRTQPPPPSEPLDDGPDLSRPPFEWVSELTIPAQFCSEYARNDYIVQVYNPAIQAALRDAALAQNHLAMLNALFTQHMRTNSPYWGQVRAERDAYDLIAQATTARAEALRALYADVIAVPLGACEDPQPPRTPLPVDDALPPPPAARPAADDAASTPKKPCPPKQGRDPIVVGPNSRVGSGAQLRSKVGGMALGALAGALGAGGGGGGGGSDGPQLWTCKIKDSEYTVFNDPVTGVSLGVAARTVKGGKMVLFSKIMKSPDKGTFQTAFLERPSTGQTIAPSDVGPCDLWGEWKLTVSWTRSTYVDGQLVSQESGGWSEGGLFRIPGMLSKVDAPDGLWKRMGFSNASNGAREMGAIFDVQPAGEPLTLVVHVTRPKGDPVTTVPFVLTLTQGADGKIGFTKAEEEPCPEETATSVARSGPTAAAGEATPAARPPCERLPEAQAELREAERDLGVMEAPGYDEEDLDFKISELKADIQGLKAEIDRLATACPRPPRPPSSAGGESADGELSGALFGPTETPATQTPGEPVNSAEPVRPPCERLPEAQADLREAELELEVLESPGYDEEDLDFKISELKAEVRALKNEIEKLEVTCLKLVRRQPEEYPSTPVPASPGDPCLERRLIEERINALLKAAERNASFGFVDELEDQAALKQVRQLRERLAGLPTDCPAPPAPPSEVMPTPTAGPGALSAPGAIMATPAPTGPATAPAAPGPGAGAGSGPRKPTSAANDDLFLPKPEVTYFRPNGSDGPRFANYRQIADALGARKPCTREEAQRLLEEVSGALAAQGEAIDDLTVYAGASQAESSGAGGAPGDLYGPDRPTGRTTSTEDGRESTRNAFEAEAVRVRRATGDEGEKAFRDMDFVQSELRRLKRSLEISIETDDFDDCPADPPPAPPAPPPPVEVMPTPTAGPGDLPGLAPGAVTPPASSGATTTRPPLPPTMPPWGPGPKPYDPRSDPEFGKLHTAGLLRLVDGLEKMRAEDIAQRRELDRARCEGPKAWEEKRTVYLKRLRVRLDIMERIVGLGRDKAAIESAAAGEVVRLGDEIAEVEAMSPPAEPQSCPVTPVPEDSESILDEIEEVLVPA